MKREILCPKCRRSNRELFPTDTPYPGEYVLFKDGIAKSDFVCDFCGDNISAGEKCTAFSSWADYGGMPYFEWEDKFLNNIT